MSDNMLNIPERINGVAEIAFNLWWSWHPSARMLFKMLNRAAWKESRHNPVKMLKEIPADTLTTFASNYDYLRHYDVVYSKYLNDIQTKVCWFAANIEAPSCLPIVYFSAEYGLHHSLPFYAGGLGFLAGDHIKE